MLKTLYDTFLRYDSIRKYHVFLLYAG